MPYNKVIPQAPLPISMEPDADGLEPTDLLLVTQPTRQKKSRKLPLSRLFTDNLFHEAVGDVDTGWKNVANVVSSVVPKKIGTINVPDGTWRVDVYIRGKMVSTYQVTSGNPGHWRRLSVKIKNTGTNVLYEGSADEVTHTQDGSLTGSAGSIVNSKYTAMVSSDVVPSTATGTSRTLEVSVDLEGNKEAITIQELKVRVVLVPAKADDTFLVLE